jgi:tetratricopeptide (TPR) repeat protein
MMTCIFAKLTNKKLKKILGATLIVLAGLAPLTAFDNTNILVEQAVNHIYQKRYLQAHQTLKEAYEQSPRHPGVHFNLGRLFELTGNYNEALKEFRLAASLDTSMVAARRGIARVQVELKRHKAQKLQQAATQAQQQRPQQTQVQTQTPGRIIRQTPTQTSPATQPAPPNVEIQSTQNLRLPPLPAAAARKAATPYGESQAERLLEDGKTDAAIKDLEEILNKNPDSPKAHFLLGKALSMKGDLFPSIKHLEETLRVDETFYDAYLLLGRNYARVNLLEDAIKNYQLYYGVRPQASVALEIARIYESMGHPAKAREYYSRANAMNPGNPNLQMRLNESGSNLANELYLRANHAFSVENFAEAVSLFSQAIETGGLAESARRDFASESNRQDNARPIKALKPPEKPMAQLTCFIRNWLILNSKHALPGR